MNVGSHGHSSEKIFSQLFAPNTFQELVPNIWTFDAAIFCAIWKGQNIIFKIIKVFKMSKVLGTVYRAHPSDLVAQELTNRKDPTRYFWFPHKMFIDAHISFYNYLNSIFKTKRTTFSSYSTNYSTNEQIV